MSSRGVYSNLLKRPERVLSEPQVCLAPALILRKRTERSFVNAFEEIIRQLKGGCDIPPGLGQFVTVTEDTDSGREHEKEASEFKPTNDLYFPLESNEAQQQIVTRLSNHQGVLVQGPPGTGKSHTIINLVCHFLATGQRVLVTSHTARALKVLQRYIREKAAEIAPLAVVLLGDDRDALQAMEESVQGITSRQNHWDPAANTRKIKQLERELDEARREVAAVMADLQSIREKETYSHPVKFGAYAGTAQTIADRLRWEERSYDWIQDKPPEELDPPMASQQFRDLLSMLRDTNIENWRSSGMNALVIQSLPSPEIVSKLVESESHARTQYDLVSEVRLRPEYGPLNSSPVEFRKQLIEELESLFQVVEKTRWHLYPWTEFAVLQILGDHDRAWRDLFDMTKEHLSQIGDRARWADESVITGLDKHDHHEVRVHAEAMLAHIEKGGGWGIGPFRAGPAKQGHYLRREVKFSGKPCDADETLKDLITWLDIEERLRLVRTRWEPYHKVSGNSWTVQGQRV